MQLLHLCAVHLAQRVVFVTAFRTDVHVDLCTCTCCVFDVLNVYCSLVSALRSYAEIYCGIKQILGFELSRGGSFFGLFISQFSNRVDHLFLKLHEYFIPLLFQLLGTLEFRLKYTFSLCPLLLESL